MYAALPLVTRGTVFG